MSNFVNLLDIVYPVGSIYQSMNETSPADVIDGTWTQIKTFLYGADTANQTGGEATHTLTIDEMPKHNHRTINQNCIFNAYDLSRVTVSSGTTATFSQGYFTVTDAGGKHTTICRPIQLALSGIVQLKSKRGSVCLTTLTSWILSTQLGQYLFQTIQSRQQIQLAGHGQSSTVIRSFAMERPAQQAVRTKENFLSQICRQMFGLQAALATRLDCQKLLISWLRATVSMVLKYCALLITITKIHNILISRLTIVQNTGHLTSISAQPSYVLGGVA